MELQDRSRYLRGDGSADNLLQDLGFVFAADNYQDLSCFHDASNAHGIGLTRNIVFRSEETLVGIDSAFCQIHTLSAAGECVCRLVEADMSVMAKAQEL